MVPPGCVGCGRNAAVLPQGLGGGGWVLRLMSGFMQEDLPFTLARVDVRAVSSACLWLRLAL